MGLLIGHQQGARYPFASNVREHQRQAAGTKLEVADILRAQDSHADLIGFSLQCYTRCAF
jgi:hypothetical protein